jgi:putative ABC transport system permease protein
MSTLWLDLRFGFRILRQAPGFTLIAVLVLALGIGANSAIFSLVDAVLLRPLPFAQPDQLAMVWEKAPRYDRNSVAPLNFLDWSEQNQVFSSMAAISGSSAAITAPDGSAERIVGQLVSPQFFEMLGARPLEGRFFNADDVAKGASVVVIGERLWRARYGANPKLVGSTLRMDSQPVTVIGIAPASVQLLYTADMWRPMRILRSPEQRRMHYLRVVGRLKPGVSIDQARSGMGVVAENIARISPETNKGWGVTITPLRQAMVASDLRVTSLVLGGVVAFVLLMACANIANLLLARGAARSREIAVRASLGGSRVRIIRQLLTENVLLAMLGGALGIALASAILRLAPALIPAGTLPAGITLALDARVIGFAALITIVTGLVFGLAPALQAVRSSLGEALRSGGRTGTGRSAFRSVLAAGEVAVAVMLVAGAGLLARTLLSLQEVDPGYRADHVLTARVGLPFNRYTVDQARAFYRAVETELAAIPGVRSAAIGGSLPLNGRDIGQAFEVVGQPVPAKADRPAAVYQMVSPNYLDAMGISLLRGRGFDAHDTAGAAPVCLINEALARRYLKDRDPIGAQLIVDSMDLAGPKPVTREVVGVVRQVKIDGPGDQEEALEIYVPIEQNAWFWGSIVVRSATDPLGLVPAVKQAVARIDKDLPLTNMRTMEEVASDAVAQPRFRAGLVGAFAGLALVLAAAGIFSVLAYAVSQRTREFGIRMALGARPRQVLSQVLGGGLRITAIGVIVGLAAAAGVTRFLAALLFGVQPLDPVTFIGAPLVLAVIAIAACLVPAWRASRVDPAIALRQE